MNASKNKSPLASIFTSVVVATALTSTLLLTACSNSSSTSPLVSDGTRNPGNGSQQESAGLFQVRGDWAIMNGEITTNIVDQLNTLVRNNPQVKTIVMADVPGSSDDEMNLQAGLRLRELGLNTYLPPGAEIASGGVDLFLAGVERSAAPDVLVGVHSWGSDEVTDASTLGRDHEAHQPYLDYFNALNINEDFYWYTIEAADADNIHWMTAAERVQYGIVTRAATEKELNMIASTASSESAINTLFSQYTWVNSANNKPIHIFAVDAVSPLQLAKARAVMSHYLTNVEGLTNKDAMSTALGDNQASLFMFANPEDSEAAAWVKLL